MIDRPFVAYARAKVDGSGSVGRLQRSIAPRAQRGTMPTRHTVQQGDCISSLAASYGIPWEKIWDFGDNAELKEKRADPNVLSPGDVIVIPDKASKKIKCATDQRHKFVVSRKPTKIKIRLTIDDQPRKGIPFELFVDGASIKGKTDGDGYMNAEVPADAEKGKLVVGNSDPPEVYELAFGTLDPIETDSGVEQRLRSLGINTEDDLAGAVATFQQNNDMEPNGVIDDALRSKLKERFGQ